MSVDVIIPSLGKPVLAECVASLRYLPFPMRLFVMLNDTWAASVNKGILASSNDVIIMDDDVRILPHTFDGLPGYLSKADIFGFKLVYPEGRIQHAGGIFRNGSLGHIGHKEIDIGQYDEPKYMAHLCGGLIYVKREVFSKIGIMSEDYKGISYEDVDFSFRALKAGLSLLYIPGEAIHLESATKKGMDNNSQKAMENFEILRARHYTDDFMELAGEFPKAVYAS